MNSTETQNSVSIAAMQVEIAHLKASATQTNAKLDQVLATLAEARGGWRTLMTVGGAMVALASGAAWLFSHWKG